MQHYLSMNSQGHETCIMEETTPITSLVCNMRLLHIAQTMFQFPRDFESGFRVEGLGAYMKDISLKIVDPGKANK